jgi:hypothetical protein
MHMPEDKCIQSSSRKTCRDLLEHFSICRIILKLILEQYIALCGLDSCGSGWRTVAYFEDMAVNFRVPKKITGTP